MAEATQALADRLQQRFGDVIKGCKEALDEVTITVAPDKLLEVCKALRDEPGFSFEQLIDVCGVDYAEYGSADTVYPVAEQPEARFAAVYHLLSLEHNERLRIKTFPADEESPRLPSVTEIWNSADWFEREAFDLMGIVFEGHPDLRRILTDYGFIGHPFRKDFPLIGNVEMRYDPEKQRVIYEPVSIEPRVLVPRVVRHDSRYMVEEEETGASGG